MNASPQYRPQTPVDTDDLLAALIPDTPAGLTPQSTPTATVPTAMAAPMTVAYLPSGQPVYVPVPIPTNLPAAPAAPAGPLVPRWAVGTAVASVGIGAGTWMLSAAAGLLADGVAALAAGASAGLPLLLLAGVAVAAAVGRRGRSGAGGTAGVSVMQTVTQTIRIGE